MTGKVMTGKSFKGVLAYCLQDKQNLSEQAKLKLEARDGLKHRGRAEVLHYNLCYGNHKELAMQLHAVSKLSRRVEQPVFHFTLNLPPGEKLRPEQWKQAGEKLAEAFNFEGHQYVLILHHDTNHQHIHCIANRIGYDGLAAPTSHSKRKIAALCRSLEQDFNLQKVLSPKAFLPKAQQNLPRKDNRKAAIKSAITHALWDCRSMESFIQKMEAGGYRVIKGRGISFMDAKKVQVKGSELGYSLAKIEKILKVKQEVVIGQGLQEKVVEKGLVMDKEKDAVEQQGEGLLATLTDGVGKDYVTGQPQKKRRKKRKLGW